MTVAGSAVLNLKTRDISSVRGVSLFCCIKISPEAVRPKHSIWEWSDQYMLHYFQCLIIVYISRWPNMYGVVVNMAMYLGQVTSGTCSSLMQV